MHAIWFAALMLMGQADTTVRVGVNLVTVEAIVLDRKGEPVRNLKKEDFQLFEDGKKQEILTLDEVTAAPTGEHGKLVMIVFDDGRLSGGQYKITRDSAELFVREHMRPPDFFAVASCGISLKVLQNFTQDSAKILQAVRHDAGAAETSLLATAGSSSDAAARDSQRLGRTVESQPSRTFASYETAAYRAGPVIRLLESLASSLAPIKGRKAVLLYSEEFAASSNIQADFRRLVTAARAANVVFYTVDARGLNSVAGGDWGQGSGPVNTAAEGRARARQPRGSDIDPTQFDRQPIDQILRPLAKETGGVAIYNTSDFNKRLQEVDLELSNYYILGFQSTNPRRDGTMRTLDVKSRIEGATIKHRDGYVDVRPLDSLAGSAEERALFKAISSPPYPTQLPVAIRTACLYESRDLARVPVMAKIPASAVEIKRKGGQVGGDINVMAVALAADGSVAARFSETQHILLDKGSEETFRKRNLIYRNYFRIHPGKYQVRLAVADEKGKIGAVEQSLVVPPLPPAQLAASSLIVADQVSRLSELVESLQAELLENPDPLTFNGIQVTPAADHHISLGAAVQVFYKLYNLSGNPGQRKFTAKVEVLGENGAVMSLPPTPLDQNVFPTGRTDAVVGIPLPLAGIAAGDYRLVIETRETTSGQSVTIETDLQLR
jgi:VWFA-related protein